MERGVREAELVAGLFERHGVPVGSRVVELGCGIGRVGVPLAARGYWVSCLDISPRFVERAREYAGLVGVSGRFEAVVGDAWEASRLLGRERYDAVLFFWTTLLGYRGSVESDLALLGEAARLARVGGRLFILRQAHRDLLVCRRSLCGFSPVFKGGEDYGIVVVEDAFFDPIGSVLENTWTYYRRSGDDLVFAGRAGFRIRIYSVTELVDLAGRVGWRLEGVYGSLRGDPFDPARTGLNIVFRRES